MCPVPHASNWLNLIKRSLPIYFSKTNLTNYETVICGLTLAWNRLERQKLFYFWFKGISPSIRLKGRLKTSYRFFDETDDFVHFNENLWSIKDKSQRFGASSDSKS
jgi:hypothetical protein